MRLFVPAFDALWKGSKASLHNATRAIFLRLCQEVRDAERDGTIVLPRARDDIDAIMRLSPGPRAEIATALEELTDPSDPMVAIDDQAGRRVLRVLSWSDWALVRRQDLGRDDNHAGGGKPDEPPRRGRPRKWTSEAERSRARRSTPDAATDSATGNETGRPEIRPEMDNRSTGNPTGNLTEFATGNSADVGGERGGVSGVQTQKRSEETRADQKETETRSARASSPGRTPDASADATPDGRAGRLLAMLRRSPELQALERAALLDLGRCVADLVTNGENYVMGGKLRLDEVDERLDAVVADIVREVASAASTSQPMPPREVARKMRTFASTTLSKSREDWQARRRPSRPGGPSSGTRARPADAELDALGLGGAR